MQKKIIHNENCNDSNQEREIQDMLHIIFIFVSPNAYYYLSFLFESSPSPSSACDCSLSVGWSLRFN